MTYDTFPLTDFLARFTEFDNEESYPVVRVQNAGIRATMHVTQDVEGMPMFGPYRNYALFLMTAHLLALDDLDSSSGDGSPSIAGTPFRATVGSVTIENTKQNSFNNDDWNYWLNQTKYGRELLAYLDTQANAGIFLNIPCDSVRDLV